jgi:hypothetical protein
MSSSLTSSLARSSRTGIGVIDDDNDNNEMTHENVAG